jgi:tubulysin polyketide synthase-like protein
MSLLATLEAKGVTLRLVDGKLRAYGELTDELRAVIREHRDELLTTLGGGHEIKHTVASAISTESGPHPDEERRETADNGAGRIGTRRPLASDLEAPQGGAAAASASGQAPDVSAPVKYTRRRSLASTPPPHTGPLTDGQCAFLYSVLKDGRVERGTLVSKDLRTELEAYAFLRKRFPGLTVQWARVVTHPVCSGCQHFTGGSLCNVDQSPDYAVRVGGCGKYESAPRY